jgi:uncharacterized protein
MGASENKQIVTEYFSHLSAGRREQALEMLGEDATWWAPGFGVMHKAQFATMMVYMEKIIRGSIQLTLKRITAEDDRVAAEAESDADVVNGKHYHNTYHILVVIRGGKIREVKEYHDTKYASEVFGDLLPANQ